MVSNQVIEVIDALVGNIHAVGSSEIDKENFEHLRCLEDIVYHYLNELMDECDNVRRHEGSMETSGYRTLKFVRNIHEEISDVLEEFKDVE